MLFFFSEMMLHTFPVTAEGFTPDLNTYNSLIKAAGVAKEDGEQKIRFIEVSYMLNNLILQQLTLV